MFIFLKDLGISILGASTCNEKPFFKEIRLFSTYLYMLFQKKTSSRSFVVGFEFLFYAICKKNLFIIKYSSYIPAIDLLVKNVTKLFNGDNNILKEYIPSYASLLYKHCTYSNICYEIRFFFNELVRNSDFGRNNVILSGRVRGLCIIHYNIMLFVAISRSIFLAVHA